MPAIPGHPWLPLACWNPTCGIPAMVEVVGAEGHSLATCLNDVARTFDWVRITPGAPGACVACSGSAEHTYRVDAVDYVGRFCSGHVTAFLARALNPDAYARVLADAGGNPEAVFHLHSDFYDDTGLAWQPLVVGAELIIPHVQALADLLELTEWDEFPLEHPLVSVAQTVFAIYTGGLALDVRVAAHMVDGLVAADAVRRLPPIEDVTPQRATRRLFLMILPAPPSVRGPDTKH